MVLSKSLDDSIDLIAALLHDVHTSHEVVFNTKALRHTLRRVKCRASSEGIGFLTKTMPRLGKAFDKALSGNAPLNAIDLGFKPLKDSKLPRFLGEFFSRVLQPNGALLAEPCATSVAVLRQILFVFYKYKLPYTDDQKQQVISAFKRAEDDLATVESSIEDLESSLVQSYPSTRRRSYKSPKTRPEVAREAKILLARLFASFDPKDIYPRHGPGVVATKQKLWEKFQWTNVSHRISSVYPLDAYFYASLGHLCDRYQSFSGLTEVDHSAQVILVPKDSRGPRLISCEPVDFQWVQQGLGRRIVELVENHWTTSSNVFFTDQTHNRVAARYGSENGRYATLDLKEASDRVSLALVRLLFPSHVYTYLEACRTSSTVLPDGKVLKLRKFAPMGSSLCFPILALTIWAILTAAAPDTNTRERILVYGDDVIVPTAYAANAIEHLESFGLLINRDKSCTSGFFRESCGMDAFKGIEVTPVRLRTVWSSVPCPDVYVSWISYSESFYKKQYYHTYDFIVSRLVAIYGAIPDVGMNLTCPSLMEVPPNQKPIRRRNNKRLQKVQYYVWDVKSPITKREIDGWSMLLRYFSEKANDVNRRSPFIGSRPFWQIFCHQEPFSVSSYTSRRTSMLVRRWR